MVCKSVESNSTRELLALVVIARVVIVVGDALETVTAVHNSDERVGIGEEVITGRDEDARVEGRGDREPVDIPTDWNDATERLGGSRRRLASVDVRGSNPKREGQLARLAAHLGEAGILGIRFLRDSEAVDSVRRALAGHSKDDERGGSSVEDEGRASGGARHVICTVVVAQLRANNAVAIDELASHEENSVEVGVLGACGDGNSRAREASSTNSRTRHCLIRVPRHRRLAINAAWRSAGAVRVDSAHKALGAVDRKVVEALVPRLVRDVTRDGNVEVTLFSVGTCHSKQEIDARHRVELLLAVQSVEYSVLRAHRVLR
mmetsp:Transcript_2828/g.9944  ORF Transcript_2828/g.9944 Transcript_2828/m.9944 type:complete len:319 (-) Transcript_2828:367-1323(-)